MNSEQMKSMRNEIASELRERLQVEQAKLVAGELADEVVAGKVERGEAYELTDDEERMLRAYRGFCARSRPGETFKWRCPEASTIVLPAEPSLIVDPREEPEIT